MARRLEYEITTDASDGIKGLKAFGAAAKKELKAVSEELGDTATQADKVAKVLTDMASKMETEMKGAAAAADALGAALGPEIASRADLGSVVSDLHRMGLSFDEITADADKLATALKEVDRVQLGGTSSGLRQTKQGLDDVGKSASSSRSVLANMVGNATQDLGALGGVAGSAGVAIGQMGEYMVDAAGDGDKLSKILKNFATVALPIAAIGVAVKGIADARERAQAAEEWRTDQLEGFVEAMREGVDVGDALAERLREIGKIEVQPGSLARAIGELDVSEGVAKAGLTFERFAEIVEGGTPALDEWVVAARAAGVAEEEIAVVVATATQQIEFQTTATRNFNKTAALFEENVKGIAAASKEWADANKPMEDMPKTWRTAGDAVIRMRQGLEPTAAQLQAVLVLTQQYGIDAGEVYNRAAGAIDEHNASMREVKAAADEAAASIPGVGAAMVGLSADAVQAAADAKEFATSIAEAQLELDDMASVFSEMSRREGAIQAAFDLGDAPFETAKNISDINVAAEDLAAFLRENPFDTIDFGPGPQDFDAAPFLAKVDALKGPVQEKLSNAFVTGGEERARAVAEELIVGISNGLDGALSPGQIDQLLFGPNGYTAVIDIAVDQASLAKAKAMIQLVAGLPGADPLWVAQVQLDLQADKITPEAAQLLVAQKAGELGLNVDTNLLPPSGQSMTDAKRSAEEFYRRNPILQKSWVEKPANVSSLWNQTQREMNRLPPLQYRTSLKIPFVGSLDAGGTAGMGGGIAGEGDGPEILNGRYLTSGPTYVPPGTRVTSTRQTARILRANGGRGLKRYDSGGVVGGPRSLTINVNTAVIGNRWDLMRQVERAGRDKLRLLGTRS